MSLLKKLVIVAGALVVLLVGGVIVYVQFIHDDAPPALEFKTLDASGASGSSAATGSTGAPSTTLAPGPGVDGTWTVTAGTEVGYRVKEDFIGGLQNSEAVGRTTKLTGSVTIQGTTATTAELTADVTTLKSDDSRRDSQVQGRILQTSRFPTARFRLTRPIDFGRIPSGAGDVVTASAVGELTLRDVTKPVTFDVEAIFDKGVVQVKGKISVEFDDYGIPSPSNAIVSVRDNGLLEFLLVLAR
jgi:polyisoprenoid-binding protein YceI